MVEILKIDGLGRSEAARELRRSTVWLDNMARSGRIGYIQTPVGRVFTREEVERVRREIESREERSLDKAA